MLKRVASFFGRHRVETMMSAFAMLLVLSSPAFAAGESNMIDPSIVTGAVTSAVTNTIQMFAALLPIALTVFAATWGIRKAIRFFKATAN